MAIPNEQHNSWDLQAGGSTWREPRHPNHGVLTEDRPNRPVESIYCIYRQSTSRNIPVITCHEIVLIIQACRQTCGTLNTARSLPDQSSCSTLSVSPFLACATHYSLLAAGMNLYLRRWRYQIVWRRRRFKNVHGMCMECPCGLVMGGPFGMDVDLTCVLRCILVHPYGFGHHRCHLS